MSSNAKLCLLTLILFSVVLFLPKLVNAAPNERGWLGIMIQRITPELQESFKLKDPTGVLVGDLVPFSPAERGGMKRGDVIRRFDGVEILSLETLPKQVASTTPGKSVNVEVIREGQVKTLVIRIDPISQVLPEKNIQEVERRERSGDEQRKVLRTYWDNGNLKWKIPYKNGVLEGLVTEWYESGKKLV